MQGNKRAYRGRVVTMDDAFTVVNDGIVWIEGNTIAAVADAAAPAPAGFEHLAAVNTGGTMFPGLIELHNHLCYDVLPLWAVPKRYDDRDQWSGTPAYRSLISKPMAVIGHDLGLAAEIARFTEVKCLLGGTTTSQGITLSSVGGISKRYRGVVRNVEESLDAALPSAKAHIQDVDAAYRKTFIADLAKYPCLLLHLSEGVDDKARNAFLQLDNGDGTWALGPALTGIHSTGLHSEDFDVLATYKAGMVWSPLSNMMLYGDTAKVKAAKAAGVTIGIGSDWSPSGSKNLLHELAFAWLCSAYAGGVFKAREIVALATRNAAALLRWTKLGSLEAGKYADLLVVRGTGGDPYETLLKAEEAKIDLVTIDGVPRLATHGLGKDFPQSSETVAVGSETRLLNLDDASTDSLVAGLTLDAARTTLRDALASLGQPHPEALFHGLRMRARQPQWSVVLDQEEPPDFNLRTRFGPEPAANTRLVPEKAAAPVPLHPIVLDELTVAGDPGYFPALKAQMNIPQAIKDELP